MALYLGIPSNSGIDWGSFEWFKIVKNLETWLRSSCQSHRSLPVFTIGGPRQNMGPLDGLVYLVGYRSDSVIDRVGAPASSNINAGQTTIFQNGMLSEVYVNPLSTYGIAATIYHELLHNKFQNIINIHNTPDGNFTSATAPYTDGGPSDADQRLMCKALQSSSTQFQGGF
jgi:hypothetical protein